MIRKQRIGKRAGHRAVAEAKEHLMKLLRIPSVICLSLAAAPVCSPTLAGIWAQGGQPQATVWMCPPGHDNGRCFRELFEKPFRIPKGRYCALHLIAAADSEPDSEPVVTAQFYRPSAGAPEQFAARAGAGRQVGRLDRARPAHPRHASRDRLLRLRDLHGQGRQALQAFPAAAHPAQRHVLDEVKSAVRCEFRQEAVKSVHTQQREDLAPLSNDRSETVVKFNPGPRALSFTGI
jgi:hypothetical protein